MKEGEPTPVRLSRQQWRRMGLEKPYNPYKIFTANICDDFGGKPYIKDLFDEDGRRLGGNLSIRKHDTNTK